MSKAIIMCGGGGGTDLDVVTAGEPDVLTGKVIVDKDGNPLTGTMPDRGAISQSLGINGTYLIPEGYHNGLGKVTQNIATMAGQTINPGTSQQTVSCSGKYMTGNIVIAETNLFKVGSGSVTSSSSKLTYKTNEGSSDEFYYFTVSISGFRKIELVAWVDNSSYGGLATGSTFNLCGGFNFGGYYLLSQNSGSAYVNATSIRLPVYSYNTTVWYYIAGY